MSSYFSSPLTYVVNVLNGFRKNPSSWNPTQYSSSGVDKNNKPIPKRIIDDLKLNELPAKKEIRSILPRLQRRFSAPALANPTDFELRRKFEQAEPELLKQEWEQVWSIRQAMLAAFEKLPVTTIQQARFAVSIARLKLLEAEETLSTLLRTQYAQKKKKPVNPEPALIQHNVPELNQLFSNLMSQLGWSEVINMLAGRR
jgi:hypothetical protein